jgi:hypothetical protein
MFNRAVLKRSLIISIALGAAACPAAAGARAIESDYLGAQSRTVQSVHTLVSSEPSGPDRVSHAAKAPAADDFRWDDAGIGAAATIVLLGAGGAAAGGLRRRQTQREALS